MFFIIKRYSSNVFSLDNKKIYVTGCHEWFKFSPRPHMRGVDAPPLQVGFVPCTPVFKAGYLIFAVVVI